MLRPSIALGLSIAAAFAAFTGCGARTELPIGGAVQGEGGTAVVPCDDGIVEPCGSDLGVCKKGEHKCEGGVFGPCEGAFGPFTESCNDLDDDCDGEVDEDFGIGQACDGADSDLCTDDIMSCAGCSLGPNDVEICNGVDDNCNGIIDADCEIGSCMPTLEVIGSTPSDPNCIDFPVEAGSKGTISYPCAGGPVTATLGGVPFTGSVVNGFVSLDGIAVVIGPDTCTWQTSHHIEGVISQGTLTYSYAEEVVAQPPGVQCWQPCTETGTVAIEWVPSP